MTPARLASSVAQRINALCKVDRLPEPWDPGQFVELIGRYTQLIRAIHEGTPDPAPRDDLEEVLEKGRPGAYRDMVKRARNHEHALKVDGKKDQSKIRKNKE